MYNYALCYEKAINYWSSPDTNSHSLKNFAGTWAISDHMLIPETILEFLLEHYRTKVGERLRHHIKNIPLNEINDLLNDVWEGPGSMPKLVTMTHNMRMQRLDINTETVKDPFKGYDTPTIESDLGENSVDRIES